MKSYALLLICCTLYAHTSSSMHDIFDVQAKLADYSNHMISAAVQLRQKLQDKANLDAPLNTTSHFPALHEALDKVPFYQFIKPLLEAGADPNISINSTIATPLHRAATHNSKLYYLLLLLQHGAKINSMNNRKQTPLMIAILFGAYQTALALLQHQADPNIQDMFGNTALHEVCKLYEAYNYNSNYGDMQTLRENMVKLLLYYHADAFIKNNQNQTALDLAQEKGFHSLVELMRNA